MVISISAVSTALFVLLLAGFLHLLPHLGLSGKLASKAACRCPTLDVVVSLFTWVPWVVGGLAGGWLGFLGALIGQFVALHLWSWMHEYAHREWTSDHRIVSFINRRLGRLRNHVGLWITVVVLPVFIMIRLAEMTLWPVLAWVMRFPRYKQADWINCSRQKFKGLVGHDLIWCLYCDWMTGVYAFGAECLRNVETFWCPIRFRDGQKCENCKLDFPDVIERWAPADSNMAEVIKRMEKQYPEDRKVNDWWGHPARLTVEGQPVEEPDGSSPEAG